MDLNEKGITNGTLRNYAYAASLETGMQIEKAADAIESDYRTMANLSREEKLPDDINKMVRGLRNYKDKIAEVELNETMKHTRIQRSVLVKIYEAIKDCLVSLGIVTDHTAALQQDLNAQGLEGVNLKEIQNDAKSFVKSVCKTLIFTEKVVSKKEEKRKNIPDIEEAGTNRGRG